jgi:thymidylate kinase
MNKIAICGTHGVGKSTLSYHLASLLKKSNPTKSVICLEENVREIAKITDGNFTSLEFTKLAIYDQLFREVKASILYDIIVTDRSLVDYMIYGQLNGNYYGFYDDAPLHMFGFNQIYFLRPDHLASAIADDGFRDTNLDFRNKVDKEFSRFFEKNKQLHPVEIKTSEILTYDYLKDLQ